MLHPNLFMRFCISLIASSYPVLLELAVEATYPVDESIAIALITMSTYIQGAIIMEMDTVLKRPAKEKFVEVKTLKSKKKLLRQ